MKPFINDQNCSWINELPKRIKLKTIYGNEDCDWLIVGAGYIGYPIV